MSSPLILAMIATPLGGLALAGFVLWLNRPATLRATETPDSASMRIDVR